MDGACKEAAEHEAGRAAAAKRAAEAAKLAAAAYEQTADVDGRAAEAAERAAGLAAAAKRAAERAAEAARPRTATEQEAAEQEAERTLTEARTAIENYNAAERDVNKKSRRNQTTSNKEKSMAIHMAVKAAMATHNHAAITNVAALGREAEADITTLKCATRQEAERRRQEAEKSYQRAKTAFEASEYAEAAKAAELTADICAAAAAQEYGEL